MRTARFAGMLYLTLLHLHTTSMVTATTIFCQAPPVFVGDPANLTCHFPQDLRQSRKSVAVVRRDSIPGSRDKLVIGCVWDGEKLVCDANEGFTLLSQQIHYEITFGIPSHEPGKFRCDYSPSENDVIAQPCSLTLKGRLPTTMTPSRSDSPTDTTERSQGRSEDDATRTFCRVPPIPEDDPATLTCHFPEDLSQSRKNIFVLRRDSIPGSQYERLAGCTWNKEKLACGVRDEIKLITRQPMYDVTFQIESRQPGTFRCHITPEDEAVTVQSCNFTSKGPYRDTTDWSQRRNEDGGPFDVITIVVIAVILSVITAVAVTLLIQRFRRRRSGGSASPLVLKHGKGESQTELATKEIQPSGSTSVEDPEDSAGQTPYQLMEEESQSCDSASPLVQKHGKGESQTELAMKEIQSCGSASPLVQKHGKGESQTELAMKEIQPAGNVLVGEPKSTKGKAKCK